MKGRPGLVPELVVVIMPRRSRRSPLTTILFFLVAASLLSYLFSHDFPLTSHPSAYFGSTGEDVVHIALTETGGSHDEVLAALVYSFASHPRVSMDIYQRSPRYGISHILNAFELPRKPQGPFRPDSFLMSWQDREWGIPDIWISTTCEVDLPRYQTNMTMLLEQGSTYLFCVVHHSDVWDNTRLRDIARPWVERNRMQFITLSPHTADYLQYRTLLHWETTVEPVVRPLAPVFPVHISETDGVEVDHSFALQGDFSPGRRDYQALFTRLESFLQSAGPSPDKNITMHLLGHGHRPRVPDSINSHVQFNENLAYPEYYSLLSRTFALLPAFASDGYFHTKASSTIPAALIAGAPLIATAELVEAYSYLSEDAVWIQEEGMSDMDVVAQVLQMSEEERRRKKQFVREWSQQLMHENVQKAAGWIHEAMDKLDKPLQ